jgi:hypothetical protein
VIARYEYDGPDGELANREILGRLVAEHHRAVLAGEQGTAAWNVALGGSLLFDAPGLALLDAALATYRGHAGMLRVQLAMNAAVFRDYYSLAPEARPEAVPLPVVARRTNTSGAGPEEVLTVRLPASTEPIPFPPGLRSAADVGMPNALLLPYHAPFDLLFANQIAILSELRRRVARSPAAWLRALVRGSGVRGRNQRLARAYRAVHPTAEVHPTAVVEGAIIGAGARVGAHCVVRYGVVAEEARLHDGAKAELSVVGAGAWLMHDLVLYRSVAERGAFLIHGPYQFSYFQQGSGGFATIMMDYRPDEKPIQVRTRSGLRAYGGPFLGAVVGEGAKTLGGSLVAPGRVVPPHAWLTADPHDLHLLETDDLPARRPSPPCASRRKTE